MGSILVIAAFVVFIYIVNAIKIVKPYEKGLIVRLGKYQKTVDSGLTLIVPFIDKIIKVDMREQVIDVPPQHVITKDNVAVEVDAVVYYEATDPFKLVFNVANFNIASTKLAQTNLRNIIGDLSLDETLTSRETINAKVRQILDDATDKWGVKVGRVELQRIDPPADVTEAMHRQMKAERDRRAIILEAEGKKRSRVLVAEGDKQAAIERATGEAEAIKRVAEASKFKLETEAEGEKVAIERIFSASRLKEGKVANDVIALRYLKALAEIAEGKATKLILPLETSGILGSIAGIGEMFKKEPSLEEPGKDEKTEQK